MKEKSKLIAIDAEVKEGYEIFLDIYDDPEDSGHKLFTEVHTDKFHFILQKCIGISDFGPEFPTPTEKPMEYRLIEMDVENKKRRIYKFELIDEDDWDENKMDIYLKIKRAASQMPNQE